MDLEKQRNEKVIPIAKVILSELATDLMYDDKKNDLVLKTLSLMVSHDLNIETEVSYIPQVLLRTLSELNATLQLCDVIPEDDEKYARIASEILSIVSKADISMDDATKEEVEKQYETVKDQLNILFSTEKLNKLELIYIKDMIFERFNVFNNMLSSSIQMATERAESKALGIETMSDLSLKRLDDFLKN